MNSFVFIISIFLKANFQFLLLGIEQTFNESFYPFSKKTTNTLLHCAYNVNTLFF